MGFFKYLFTDKWLYITWLFTAIFIILTEERLYASEIIGIIIGSGWIAAMAIIFCEGILAMRKK